jgi:hypothetical protein
MPSLFWAVLAGAALLGAAAIVNMLFGRDLTRTRTCMFAVKRLSESTRHFNDAAVEKAGKAQPFPLPPVPGSLVTPRRRRPILREK